jgi:hypothetical protein
MKYTDQMGREVAQRIGYPVDDETALSKVPSDIARAESIVFFVKSASDFFYYDGDSTDAAVSGAVVVPEFISSTDEYEDDPTTAPGRFLIRGSGASGAAAAIPLASPYKAPAYYATTANLSATRSGDVLTASGSGALSIDGASPEVGDRILVWKQTTGADNGLYVVTVAGDGSTAYVLTRAVDANTSAKMPDGMIVVVTLGSTLGKHIFQLTVGAAITLNTTALVFTDITAQSTSPAYFTYQVPLEAANAALVESSMIGRESVVGVVTAVDVKVRANVTQDDTDYATITVRRRDSDGTNSATVASATTKITGGVALLAFQWVSLGSLTNTTKAANAQYTVEIAKSGAGKVVGTAAVRVTVRTLP